MGRSNTNFHGISYTHRQEKDGTAVRHHFAAVHPERGEVGELQIVSRRGVDRIVNVDVDYDLRRQGIATGMLTSAKKAGLNPAHNKERTASGDAWAQAVGGEIPPNKLAKRSS